MKRSFELIAASAGADAGQKMVGFVFESIYEKSGGELCAETRANLQTVVRDMAQGIAGQAIDGQPECCPGHRDLFKTLCIDSCVAAFMAEIERRFAERSSKNE